MANTCIYASAIRVVEANNHVVEADERRQCAHRRDQPERAVPRDGKRQSDDVGLACPPVAIQDGCSTGRINVTRTFGFPNDDHAKTILACIDHKLWREPWCWKK